MKKAIGLIIALSVSSVSALPLKKGETLRVQIKDEYIIQSFGEKINHQIIKNLGNNQYLVKANGFEKSLNQYTKVYPNYLYLGDYRDVENDLSPNDTYLKKQIHHEMIQTFDAWKTTKGDKEIIIAVTDNEFQIDHKDLQGSWWTNENEIPDNGVDDDNNGYVDDVYGWDFIGKDNNVDSTDDPTHGTHVSGIISSVSNNKFGGAGIAPNVKVMPLRWYGSEGDWTSAVIAETYNYAIDNGAKIISTSYNIDRLVDDQLYRDVLDRAEKEEVLVINSAGNANKKNPNRQKIENIVLVCSVSSSDRSKDVKSRFSNYGSGIDICAPGDPIFSTVQVKYGTQDQSAELSGTSMAAPVVAAVSALIWSAYPNLTLDELKQKLFDSVDPIEKGNELYKGLLGHGRVNALKAVK